MQPMLGARLAFLSGYLAAFSNKLPSKLLGVHLNDSLRWDDHKKSLVTSCYGTLTILKKIKKLVALENIS